MATKQCTGCSRSLPLSSYYQKSPDSSDGRKRSPYGRAMQPCKECRIARPKELKADPARKQQIRSWNLKKLYNLTLEEYEALLSAQGGGCAICGIAQGTGRSGVLHVDHDHTTGKVRGLLCHNCNKGIGCLQDNPDLLRSGVRYLERGRAQSLP